MLQSRINVFWLTFDPRMFGQSNHGKFATARANGNGSVVKRGENVHQYVAAAKDRAGCNQSNGD